MMISGTACASPVSDAALTPIPFAMSGWNSEISLCRIPIPSAVATVIANDENRPTSAAASAGRIAIERMAPFSVRVGANRIAASAARNPAMRWFTNSIRAGAHRAIDATRRFSETADVARPNSVWR